MRKYGLKVINLFIVFLMVFSSLVLPVSAKEAETLGDLRIAYENLVAKKQANDNKTQAAKNEIARKEAAITQAEKDIHAAEHDQEVAQEKIDKSNVKISELTDEAEKILLYLQQVEGQNAYVEYVSGASSITDLISRVEAVKQVTGYIQDTMNNLEKEIDNNEKLKIDLEKKQKKLSQQIVTYQGVIAAQYSNIDSYDKYALSIDEELEIAKQNYDYYKKVCKENLGKTNDSVKLEDCSKVPTNSGWLKPLTSGVTTSTVGTRWGSFHNAMDIGGNPEGTKIYAAAAGQVSGIVYRSSCGGNRVYIKVTVGGKKYTTYYYHLLKINVKVGDIVTQSTVIGTVGGGRSTSSKYGGYDSCTTGAHLHYGVATGWHNGHVGSRSLVMAPPPGFPNKTGYRFTSRTDFYRP